MFGFGSNKSYGMRHLTAEDLDTVIQKLAADESLFDFGTSGNSYTSFRVSVNRNWSQDDRFWCSYNLWFPGRVWKKLRLNLSDQETTDQLLGRHND